MCKENNPELNSRKELTAMAPVPTGRHCFVFHGMLIQFPHAAGAPGGAARPPGAIHGPYRNRFWINGSIEMSLTITKAPSMMSSATPTVWIRSMTFWLRGFPRAISTRKNTI